MHNFLFLLLKWTRKERKEGGDDDEENNFFSGISSADVSDSITEEELGGEEEDKSDTGSKVEFIAIRLESMGELLSSSLSPFHLVDNISCTTTSSGGINR